VRTPGAKIRLECFCVRRQPTYQPTGALDGDEVIIDTLKVTPNRYPYYDFSHDLGLLRAFMLKTRRGYPARLQAQKSIEVLRKPENFA
jgi:hypothetical protein